jgi:predicted phosphodiesterase
MEDTRFHQDAIHHFISGMLRRQEQTMKILLVSDQESKFIWEHFDADRFKDIDFILSSGDLKSEYLSFLVTMVNKPLFYVHGNHDLEYTRKPPEGCDSIDGCLVRYRGLRILGLGGCMKYGCDKGSSIPPYQFSEKEMARRIRRLSGKINQNKGFDILVTHSAAAGICDGQDLCHTGFHSLLTLVDLWKPSLMVHGHMHMGFGRGKRYVEHGPTKVYDAFEYHILEI